MCIFFVCIRQASRPNGCHSNAVVVVELIELIATLEGQMVVPSADIYTWTKKRGTVLAFNSLDCGIFTSQTENCSS